MLSPFLLVMRFFSDEFCFHLTPHRNFFIFLLERTQIPAPIQALFDRIQSEFKEGAYISFFIDHSFNPCLHGSISFVYSERFPFCNFLPPSRAEFELFRSTPNARFKTLQGTQPLLIQVYALIRDLPQNSRRESQAELDRIYYPLKGQSIRVCVSRACIRAEGRAHIQFINLFLHS